MITRRDHAEQSSGAQRDAVEGELTNQSHFGDWHQPVSAIIEPVSADICRVDPGDGDSAVDDFHPPRIVGQVIAHGCPIFHQGVVAGFSGEHQRGLVVVAAFQGDVQVLSCHSINVWMSSCIEEEREDMGVTCVYL